MSKPVLVVIAGCNGSGKSTFSKPLSPENFTPFDYDFQFLRFYNALMDSDIREAMAHRMAFNELESQIKKLLRINRVSATKQILTQLLCIGLNYSKITDMIYISFFCALIQFKKLKKGLRFE